MEKLCFSGVEVRPSLIQYRQKKIKKLSNEICWVQMLRVNLGGRSVEERYHKAGYKVANYTFFLLLVGFARFLKCLVTLQMECEQFI